MKSSHVLTKFFEITGASPTAHVDYLRLLINVPSGEKTRVLALSWLPAAEFTAESQTCGIDLYNGLPDTYSVGDVIADSVTDSLAYRTLYGSASSNFASNHTAFVFPEMPSHGLLFTDSIYVVGRGTTAVGASAVFITYQSG